MGVVQSEAYCLCCFQFLLERNISYDPENLFEDVQTTIQHLHRSEEIHEAIATDSGKFVDLCT